MAATSFDALAKAERESGFDERPVETDQFFRSGKIGAWKDKLTDAQVARVVDACGVEMQRFGYC